jgi:hypothetical protein
MIWIFSVVWICLPVYAFSQQQPLRPFKRFTLHWENDVFARTDRDYSNGLKLTWSTDVGVNSAETENLPGFIYAIADLLPRVNDPRAHRAMSIFLGQNIYTPEDTKSPNLIEKDRPYAGYAYTGVGFLARKDHRLDVWEIDAGIVGPLSFAEDTQNWVHQVIHSSKARGWDHQLKNEPGLDVIRETKWRIWSRDFAGGLGADLIPHLGWRLGNISIYGNTGAELRLGWQLPGNFGTCPIRPGCNIGDPNSDGIGESYSPPRFGAQIFLAADGRYVLRNIFLDGNTLTDSHSVDKKPFVADLMAGIGVQYQGLKFTYAYVYRTPEFEEREEPLLFGAVTLSWSY